MTRWPWLRFSRYKYLGARPSLLAAHAGAHNSTGPQQSHNDGAALPLSKDAPRRQAAGSRGPQHSWGATRVRQTFKPGGGASHNTMREALLAQPRKPLMTDERAGLDDTRGAGTQPSVTRVAVNDGEWPEATLSVEEFLQAFPAMTHELSEAMTAISAYLTGSRHMFERGERLDGIQSAIEQADAQARRAKETIRRLRESFSKLGGL